MNEPWLTVKLPNGADFPMYTPSDKQMEFHQSEVSKLIAIGNRSGGKSVMLRFDAHMRALSCPGVNLILVRKTYKDLLKSHVFFQANKLMPWGSLKKEMELLGGQFNKTDYICHYPNGSRLFLSYVGHESDALNLLSAEFAAAYFDELSTIPWDFFTKLAASVRVSGSPDWKPVIRAATNPLGESTPEIMQHFVDKQIDFVQDQDYDPREWGHIKIQAQDNPHIDSEKYLKDLAGLNLPEHIRKAWIEGEYFDETALFSFHPTRDGKPYHVVKELDIDGLVRRARIYCVYDHGFKPDPAYCAWIAHLGNRYIVFHEKVWYETVVKDIAASIKAENKELGIDRVVTTYCDPTIDIKTGYDYRTMKDLFEENGVPMECSINNREQFASAFHTALADEVGDGVPKLQIYNDGPRVGCPYLVKTIPLMRYNPKRPLALDDHKHDHAVISVAYFLISNASYDSKPMKQSFHRSGKLGRPRAWALNDTKDLWILGQNNIRNK